MAVNKFSGSLDLDLKLKVETKTFKNEESNQDIDYLSFYVEVPGIGGKLERVNLYFAQSDKKLAKYILEAYINNALEKKQKADSFFNGN